MARALHEHGLMAPQRVLLIFTLLFACNTQGCGHVSKVVLVKQYEPWFANTSVRSDARWTVLPAVLVSEGWRVIEFDETQHRMSAVRDHDETPLRDRVTVVVEPAGTRIALRTSAREPIDPHADDRICATYGYARERELASFVADIAATMGKAPSAPTAALGSTAAR